MQNRQVVEAVEEAWEFEIPTSMIDVVFLLLIFFMLSTRFRALEKRLDADLLDGIEGERHLERAEELRVRIYWADPAGRAVRGPDECPGANVRIDLGNRRVRDLNELAALLGQTGRTGNNVAAVIDARRRVPFMWVAGALDACRRAGIEKVRFQAPVPEGTGGSDWGRM